MKRVFTAALAAMILILTLTSVVSASNLPRITDHAGLLTSEEKQLISDALDSSTAECGMDIVIMTATDTDGKSDREFADGFYDSTGYDTDGVLLFINPQTRHWYISTSGDAIIELTDSETDEIIEYSFDGFDSGYCTLFLRFTDKIPSLLTNDERYLQEGSREGFNWKITAVIAVIIGFFGGWIPAAIEKRKLKSVHADDRAANYVKKDSFVLTDEKDIYLYSNLTKTAKPENDGREGPSHTSSTGASHGGHGGKF